MPHISRVEFIVCDAAGEDEAYYGGPDAKADAIAKAKDIGGSVVRSTEYLTERCEVWPMDEADDD